MEGNGLHLCFIVTYRKKELEAFTGREGKSCFIFHTVLELGRAVRA